MKLTKDEQIKLLNESIQQLMQENTELKAKQELSNILLNLDLENEYRRGWDEGYAQCAEANFYE